MATPLDVLTGQSPQGVSSLPEMLLLAPWLARDLDPRSAMAVRRSLCDIGIREVRGAKAGKNRGARIDSYNRASGLEVSRDITVDGAAYCASAAGAWWRYGGHDVPSGYASCDNWYWWALKTGRFTGELRLVLPGFAILYGHGARENPATHIGLVIRNDPSGLATMEANTTTGNEFDRDADAFAVKWLSRLTDRPILGYVSPVPLSPAP